MIYPVLGEYPQAVTQAQQAIVLDPNFAISYFLLAFRYQNLGRFQDAGNALDLAVHRRLKLPDFLLERYDLAFLRDDTAAMRQAVALAKEQPGAEEWIANHQSSVLAYSGYVQQAQEMSAYAEELARQSDHGEAAALYQAGEAVWEAWFGDTQAAKQHVAEALALSTDRGVEYGAAYALAIAGDTRRSESLTNDLEKRFPQDTSVIFSYLPTLHARLALDQGDPARAIELLKVAAPNELGTPRTAIHANFGAMYPVYERGEAYLAERRGTEAAAEFQKILGHPGVVISDPIGVLAHLQLARAYVLAGDKVRAKSAYQDFLNLWKNADPDIPILKQAKSEYAELR